MAASRATSHIDADALLYARFVASASEAEIAWATREAARRGETVQQLVARVWREQGEAYVARQEAREATLDALRDSVYDLAEQAARRARCAGRRAA
ncbi:MAG TPA: hypothetical protein VFL90_06320 [Methylomirabilota bacterium]|nr:hypothetical protein [Methylomirabilota bacterium]